MNLEQARSSEKEETRTENLLSLIPSVSGTALDVGARDGYFSKLLAKHFENVITLDLECPSINFPNVQCVKGDVTSLEFENDSFQLVFCAEVLEHISPDKLAKACEE